MSEEKKPINGYVEVFSKYFFHRGLGRRVYAHEKGLKVFRFLIPVEKYKSPEEYHKGREKRKVDRDSSGKMA